MTTKDMIREYCLMYVDIHGMLPDMVKLTEMSDYEIKILYTDMLLVFNRIGKNSDG